MLSNFLVCKFLQRLNLKQNYWRFVDPDNYEFTVKNGKTRNSFYNHKIKFQIVSPEKSVLPGSLSTIVVQNCPFGWGRDGTVCKICRAVFYNLEHGFTECKPCYSLKGMTCLGGNNLKIHQGYWIHTDKQSNKLTSFLCPPGRCILAN